jgi:hypothetical protein
MLNQGYPRLYLNCNNLIMQGFWIVLATNKIAPMIYEENIETGIRGSDDPFYQLFQRSSPNSSSSSTSPSWYLSNKWGMHFQAFLSFSDPHSHLSLYVTIVILWGDLFVNEIISRSFSV